MKPTKRLLAVWLVALMLPAVVPGLLTGCQPVKHPAPPTVTTTGCAAFSRIIVPSADAEVVSLPLLKAIHDHNVSYDRLCGKK